MEMIATPRPPSTFGRLVDFAYTRRPGFEMRLMPAIERSRFGPNFSSRTRFLPTSASSTFQPVMKPSCWRISAMCDLILLCGITTESWYAEFALRRRVSMSAMGSVMVMNWPSASLAGVSCMRHPSPHSVAGRVRCGDLRRSKSVMGGGRPTPQAYGM